MSQLIEQGKFKNVFEVENNKGAAYLKMRIEWEKRCFHSLYDFTNDSERPKYGALNFTCKNIFAATPYGSCVATLKNLRQVCTIAPGDTSVTSVIGVLDFCNHIINTFTDDELRTIDEIANGLNNPIDIKRFAGYKEIQIHGDIHVRDHIESIAFAGDTPAERECMELLKRSYPQIIVKKL